MAVGHVSAAGQRPLLTTSIAVGRARGRTSGRTPGPLALTPEAPFGPAAHLPRPVKPLPGPVPSTCAVAQFRALCHVIIIGGSDIVQRHPDCLLTLLAPSVLPRAQQDHEPFRSCSWPWLSVRLPRPISPIEFHSFPACQTELRSPIGAIRKNSVKLGAPSNKPGTLLMIFAEYPVFF
jgi:hypothetical protein